MTHATMSNHAAVRVASSERDRIRAFYGEILGCTFMRSFDDKDDFRMGDDLYIAFLYAAGRGAQVDHGVSYGPDDVLRDDDFLKAICLELKVDDVEAIRRRIADFDVPVLPVSDPHLYFQAPGGQVYRLIGSREDMSTYEGSE